MKSDALHVTHTCIITKYMDFV